MKHSLMDRPLATFSAKMSILFKKRRTETSLRNLQCTRLTRGPFGKGTSVCLLGEIDTHRRLTHTVSVCLSVCLSLSPFRPPPPPSHSLCLALSNYNLSDTHGLPPSIRLCLAGWLSVCLAGCLTQSLSVCLPACLSVCLTRSLSVCLSVCLCVCMCVCVCVCVCV